MAMRRRIGRAGLLGLLAGIAMAVSGCGDRTLAPGPIRTPSSSGNHVGPTSSGLASAYAAAIRSFVGRPSGGLYLYDFTCPDVVHAPATPACAGAAPIPADVPPAVVTLLARWAVVQVIGRDTPIPQRESQTVHDSLVTFGPARPHGTQLYLQVSYVCGALCGQGATLVLSSLGSGWQVTGQTGPRWIS